MGLFFYNQNSIFCCVLIFIECLIKIHFPPMDDGQQGTFVEPNANVGDSNQNDVLLYFIPRETES